MARELFLEDFAVGQRYGSGQVSVSADEIKAFAAQFDPQPFHLDEEAAEASFFRGLAASGWHTAALTMRLLVEGGSPVSGGLIGAGGEIAWPNPTRPGDTLSVETEIVDIVASRSRPDRGMVVMRMETRNQKGQVVQRATMKALAFRRPGGA